FLSLAGGPVQPMTSKTANCCIRYMPERVVGVFDRAQAGKTVQQVLGFGGALPVVGNFEQGLGLGATAVLIGIAPMGGRLPAEWRGWLGTAIERGLEVWSGLHTFIAGASEWLVLEAAKDADIILVEGQGSLIHPGYSGVTLGLLHGCCPDALILCHQATRDHIGDYHGREPWVKIPPLPELVEIYE